MSDSSVLDLAPYPDCEGVSDSPNEGQVLPDTICLSHLRWDFVYQRPQHLLSRYAREGRVFFFEEPIIEGEMPPWLEVRRNYVGIWIALPHLPRTLQDESYRQALRMLLNQLIADHRIRDYLLWYYSPMFVAYTRHLQPLAIIYDCMDDLSSFKGAPSVMRNREAELLGCADVVFTGGQSLYEAKCSHHPKVYAFPSSVDVGHFSQARTIAKDPVDQAHIPHPRLGFFGVIDERMDLELITGIADARPDWHLVLIGPVAKIETISLPQRENIHYLGMKAYQELPAYLAGWDVALLPFAINESTRFISPTKTPEYLAAARPVVSTPIRDVICPYGIKGLVRIAATVPEFVMAIEAAISQKQHDPAWLQKVDQCLAQTSWDRSWRRMRQVIEDVVGRERKRAACSIT